MTVGGRSANRGSGYQMEMSEDQGYVTWEGGVEKNCKLEELI